MSVEAAVAEHGARLEAHEKSHDAHRDEFGKVWAQIEKAAAAREATNLELQKLTGTVNGVVTELTSLNAFIRGDARTAAIGMIAAIVVLAALFVLAMTGDINAIHDAAAGALPGGGP